MTKCTECGTEDPFMRSWFSPETETAEITYVREWFPELLDALIKEIDVGVSHPTADYHYHLARKRKTHEPSSVYRWLAAIDKVGLGPREGGRRKNRHIKKKHIPSETFGNLVHSLSSGPTYDSENQ